MGFDWGSARIIFQPVTKDAYSPGWADADECCDPVEVDPSHPFLDEEFESGYGAPYMPRFIATDGIFLYHPAQYDGSTWVETTEMSFNSYLKPGKKLPYPGG